MAEPDKEATGAATIEAAASKPPTERPASAACRAGTSLLPSPQYPTTCPKPCKGHFVYNLVEAACVNVHHELHEVASWC